LSFRNAQRLGAILAAWVWIAAGTAAWGDGPVAGELVVVVSEIRSAEGWIRVAVWEREQGFPGEVEFALRTESAKAEKGELRVSFADLPPGNYSVSVVHDVDGDGDFDTGVFGRPLEPAGASHDGMGFFGPSDFEDTVFTHPAEGGSQPVALYHW